MKENREGIVDKLSEFIAGKDIPKEKPMEYSDKKFKKYILDSAKHLSDKDIEEIKNSLSTYGVLRYFRWIMLVCCAIILGISSDIIELRFKYFLFTTVAIIWLIIYYIKKSARKKIIKKIEGKKSIN